MSKVIYSDFETSQIRYIAQIMEKFLKVIYKNKEIKEENIPKGTYETSLNFIDLVLDAESGSPKNPSESYFNYYIAAKSIDLSFPEFKSNPEKISEILKDYKKILQSLNSVRKLSDNELKEIDKMHKFFNQMFIWANNLEYEKLSKSEWSPGI